MKWNNLGDPTKMDYYITRDNINKSIRKRLQEWYWRIMAGATVIVKWPILSKIQTTHGPFIFTGDPNESYRPWLEENVGKQGIDWEWRVRFGVLHGERTDHVQIYLRRGKTKFAPMIALMWN